MKPGSLVVTAFNEVTLFQVPRRLVHDTMLGYLPAVNPCAIMTLWNVGIVIAHADGWSLVHSVSGLGWCADKSLAFA